MTRVMAAEMKVGKSPRNMTAGLYHPAFVAPRVAEVYFAWPARGSASLLYELQMEDVVRMRKPHPCGGTDWRVVRLGADIGLKCQTCGHRILLPRRQLAPPLKSLVEKTG